MRTKINKIAVLLIILFTTIAGVAQAADVTMHALGATKQVLDATTDTVKAGYYSATTLHAIDADLNAGNIAVSTTIFGITGTYTGSNYALPDTGVTLCYDSGNSVTPCAGTGQDGYYNPSTTQMSYSSSVISGAAITIDNRTGLMWAQDGEGAGCKGAASKVTWLNAIIFCEGLSFAGYDDWRLPNVKELMSIVDYSRGYPVVNVTFFPNTNPDNYKSSTTDAASTGNTYNVQFFSGKVESGSKGSAHSVRCVRAGP